MHDFYQQLQELKKELESQENRKKLRFGLLESVDQGTTAAPATLLDRLRRVMRNLATEKDVWQFMKRTTDSKSSKMCLESKFPRITQIIINSVMRSYTDEDCVTSEEVRHAMSRFLQKAAPSKKRRPEDEH